MLNDDCSNSVLPSFLTGNKQWRFNSLSVQKFLIFNLTESIAGKFLSAELQLVSSAAIFVVRFKIVSSGAHLSAHQFVSLSASCWLGTMQLAILKIATLFAALPCTLSGQLQSVS